MSKERPSIRTPIGRVRHLGPAGHGTSDFFRQRLTAIAVGLLTIPFILIVLSLIGRNHAATAQILGSPLIAIALILFIAATIWHMKIGMQVIIEDYVHGEKTKLAAIIANNFFSAAVGIASIYALFKLSSGV